MSNVAVRVISIVIGVFLISFGTLKLGPLFIDELYRSVRKSSIRMLETFPLSSLTEWNVSPDVIRRVYGAMEVVGGVVLASCPGIAQDVSNVVLLVLMLLHLFGIWRAGDGLGEASNAIVLCLMLTCRFIIRVQLMQKNEEATEMLEYVKKDMRKQIIMLQREFKKLDAAFNQLEQNTHKAERNNDNNSSDPTKS
ncbi:unnamed protein product [Trichobilharzia szidati]|nr:unnamed protein product [Trichobilharzia szidati]